MKCGFQSLVTVGEERDVFFGEVEVCYQVCFELFVKRAGVGKPAFFPDLFDEGSIFLEWGERGFGDKDWGHFSVYVYLRW